MIIRTFGWIQNSSKTSSLKSLVKVFVYNSDVNKTLRETKLERLIKDANDRDYFIKLISVEKMNIPYKALKGRSHGGGIRRSAPCSGIAQAAIPAQGGKEYTDDWSADCFLRWAVSLGFLVYNRDTDSCGITDDGILFADTRENSREEKERLGRAYLSYPPAIRVLSLLNEYGHLTKFEIGAKLGFSGEAGFTSVPQNLFVHALCTAPPEERKTIKSNIEGDSDKYARMICGWLIRSGWVKRETKTVTEKLGVQEYTAKIGTSYIITLEGRRQLKAAQGQSSHKKMPKIVLWESLATKPSDSVYLRNRRARIIKYISGNKRTLVQIMAYLASLGFFENENTILDDIHNFTNIGISVQSSGNTYKITDDIIQLAIPAIDEQSEKSDVTKIKDVIRDKLKTVNHKYLSLIDLSFNSRADRDFEIQTIALLVNEIGFEGCHLGGSRRPDGIIYKDTQGVIIDNKAYSEGFTLPIGEQDKMMRYIEDNQKRNAAITPNRWWLNFPFNVSAFSFLFVSSFFSTEVSAKLNQLSLRAKIQGGAINAQNLLLLAEEIKSGRKTHADCFRVLKRNCEIIPPY
jgi:predicted Rdx family selenoprotein